MDIAELGGVIMKQILCYGDSNTWGYNPENGARFPWGVRWTSIVQDMLNANQTQADDQLRIIEEGLCGRTSIFEDELRKGRKGIETLSILLESHSPLDTIILMLGTNDCKQIYSANETVIGKGIDSMIQLMKQLQPQARLILLSPIHLGPFVWKTEFDPEFSKTSIEVSHKLKEVYREIALKNQISFLAASDYATYSEKDMEHMDAKMHMRLAKAIYNVLVHDRNLQS